MKQLEQCRRVLLYGGSFDPPHRGHVELPTLAMRAIEADAVAYIPAAHSPLKHRVDQAPAEHRLAMLRLALRDVPHAHVLTDELDRAGGERASGPSYTVDTLASLRQRLPETIELRLLIGADNVRVFDRWKAPHRVIELAEPVIMLRPPQTRAQVLDTLPAGFDRAAWAQRFVDLPLVDVSSTDIRSRVAAGASITGLVPRAVERYIIEHGLYRT